MIRRVVLMTKNNMSTKSCHTGHTRW